ncbi:protein PLANT CADMIUM RESISTANCE 3 [Elysia marginata]|uniref:Protein PLANT CADMIUM RESISTANCE 3 n=1 Tax=Elysia marginata TaxID=1093978 RepID=A0AAV4JW67_9GAST|nr:protein PLANT CADMIUM RESISTANCE 3 [Elysia marginata]
MAETNANEFKHGLFGCFDNMGLCVITYFVPCYTFGKNQEKLGENCLLCGLAYLFFPLDVIFHTMARGKIRESKNIEGSTITDLLTVCCCRCCALIQESQELEEPGAVYVDRS